AAAPPTVLRSRFAVRRPPWRCCPPPASPRAERRPNWSRPPEIAPEQPAADLLQFLPPLRAGDSAPAEGSPTMAERSPAARSAHSPAAPVASADSFAAAPAA